MFIYLFIYLFVDMFDLFIAFSFIYISIFHEFISKHFFSYLFINIASADGLLLFVA